MRVSCSFLHVSHGVLSLSAICFGWVQVTCRGRIGALHTKEGAKWKIKMHPSQLGPLGPLKQIPKRIFVPSLCLLWAQDLPVLPSNLAHFVGGEPDEKVKWPSLAPVAGKDLEQNFFLGFVLGVLEDLIKRGAF